MNVEQSQSPIPPFHSDGYLPEGIHFASEAEVIFRFGSPGRRRRRLILRLRDWLELARLVGAHRFLIDGSFVTDKAEPNDLDAVMLIPSDFELQLENENEAALKLEAMFFTRQPEELFAAEDDDDWDAWVEFFSRTREANGRQKGLVEVEL